MKVILNHFIDLSVNQVPLNYAVQTEYMPSFTTWHVFCSELHTVSVFSGYLNKNRTQVSQSGQCS